MTSEEAMEAKESGLRIVVLYPGIRGRRDVKSGVITEIKKKLKSGRIWSYATVEWARPTMRGETKSDVLVGRIRSVQQVLEGC